MTLHEDQKPAAGLSDTDFSGADVMSGYNGKKPKKKKTETKGGFFLSLFLALAIAVTFRSLVFEPFYIPSGSMKPTLLVGDYVFVSKYTYGYSRYSFPLGLPLFEGRKFGRLPKRGEIAVFKHPKDTKINYIKRVIGLPGDELQMIKGALYVNGTQAPRIMQQPFEDRTPEGFSMLAPVYKETLPNGASFMTLDTQRRYILDNTPVYKVPEGHYFMMGDNRDNSEDSRVTEKVGPVPLEHFVGPARTVMFSSEGTFFKIINWIRQFRTDRVFIDLAPDMPDAAATAGAVTTIADPDAAEE